MKITITTEIEAKSSSYATLLPGELFVFQQEQAAFFQETVVSPVTSFNSLGASTLACLAYLCQKREKGYVRLTDTATVLYLSSDEAKQSVKKITTSVNTRFA